MSTNIHIKPSNNYDFSQNVEFNIANKNLERKLINENPSNDLNMSSINLNNSIKDSRINLNSNQNNSLNNLNSNLNNSITNISQTLTKHSDTKVSSSYEKCNYELF